MRIFSALLAFNLLLTSIANVQAKEEDRLQKPVIPHAHIAQMRAQLKELGFGTLPFDEVAQRVVDTGSPPLAFRLLLDGPEVRFWNTSWANQENAVAEGRLSRLKLVHLAEQAGWGKLTEYPTRDISTAIYRGHPDVVEFILRNWEVKPEEEWWLAEAAEHKQLETVDLFIRLYEKEPWFEKQLPRALSEAIQAEQLPIVKRLLAAGADPNEVNPFDWYNPLQLAIRHKETQILELLLAKGATLDACSAAGLGRLDDLKRLVDEPLPRHLSRSAEPLPMFWAARKGQLACLQYLLAKGDDVNARGRRGWTPLHMAIFSGDAATVELLLAHQADPLAMAEAYYDQIEYLAPMHVAAAVGKLELVQLFVQRGVSPWLRGKQWARDQVDTPLPVANCPSGRSALQLAALRKHPEVVRYLLQLALKELQTDLRQLSEENADTALSVAAAQGEVEFCRQLLAEGVKLEGGASITGTNPLEAAAGAGQSEVVKLLLAAEANPSGTKSDSSSTPLHLAAKEGHTEVVRLLLDAGAAIDTHSLALPVRTDELGGVTFGRNYYVPAPTDGPRPLTLAAQHGHSEVVKLLLARGAQPDLERTESPEPPAKQSPQPRASRPQKVKRSDTPLEALLDYYSGKDDYEQRTAIAKLLIDAGARLDPSRVKDCLEKVAERGDVVRLELLERAGAKISSDDTRLLKTAIEHGNRQFVQALIVRGVLPIALRDYHSYPVKDSSFERATPLMVAMLIEACPDQLLPLRNHFGLPATLTKSFSDPLLHCGELLRYYGGEPLPPDPQWLARAIEKGDLSAVKQLLASGYTPNSMTRSAYPPIYQAVNGGRLEIAQLLVAQGANLESFADGGSGLLTIGPDENPDLPAMMDLLIKLVHHPVLIFG
jgi:ankyrin repeat protein